MFVRMRKGLLAAALTLALSMAAPLALAATPVVLKVFAGGQNNRPELMEKLFREFEKENLGIQVRIETGPPSSDAQAKFLMTTLGAKDTTIDVYLADIVMLSQYYKAGWAEPLNAYLGEPEKVLADYLTVYMTSNVVDGKLVALPAFADALFMYYRKDLLAKHLFVEPRTLEGLTVSAKKIMAVEKNPALQGFSVQGAPIEGTVCTFLIPYWSQGYTMNEPGGRLIFNKDAAKNSFLQWRKLIDAGVIDKGVGAVKTGDSVNQFMAGNAVYTLSWGFAWNRFENDPASTVKGKVGVMFIPPSGGGKPKTCVGGWQWVVSAFSKHKAAAAKLVRFMAQKSSSKFLALEGSLMPTQWSLYNDAEVIAKVPWLYGAGLSILLGETRPVSPRYPEVSEVIRSVTSNVLAGKTGVDAGVEEMHKRLQALTP